MYTTSTVLLFIILIYLVSIYIRSKNKKSHQNISLQEKRETHEETKEKDVVEGTTVYEQAAIAAVIAAVMGDVAYSIKRVCYIPSFDERRSNWKISGRNESMMRRVFFKK